MKQYAELVRALAPKVVTFDHMEPFMAEIEQTGNDIHRRRPRGNLEDQITKCLIGSVCEHGVKLMLDTDRIWSRFSKQETYQDRMYDLGVIQKDKYERWDDHEIKIDVKSSNKHCGGLYFAFNCFNNGVEIDYNLQHRRPGANLEFFIRESKDTELLLTVDRQDCADGWLITPKYLMHRNAFNRPFNVSEYATSPYFYLRYNDLIRDGLCVKIPQQPS